MPPILLISKIYYEVKQLMKKPYKVLSATALAAVLATSSFVPVIAQAATANEVSDVIVTKDSVNYKMTQAQYSQLLDANKNPGTVTFVKSSTGKTYTLAQYSNAIDAAATVDEALTQLDQNATAQNPTTVDATFDSNGNLVTTPPVAGDLKVESVKAINASELKVTFSTAVDATTAKDPDNYDLKINNKKVDGTNGEILDIQLSKDGKVATILLDQANAGKKAFQNGDKYVIQTNNAILSKDGKKLEKYVSNEAVFSETAAPALVSVSKKGSNLELTFDRPVDATTTGDVALVKIDGIAIGSKELKPTAPKSGNSDVLGTAGIYSYTIAISDATALAQAKKLGTHEVVIFDIKDTDAAFPANASVLTGSYTITDQVVAPQVTGIEAVNANRLFVYTNTDVTLDADSVVTVNKGTHEFTQNASPFDGTITDDAVTSSDAVVGTHDGKPGIWVVVSDNKGTAEDNPLYRSGEAAVNLTVTVEKYKADGLIGAKSVKNVTLNKNDTKPTVNTALISPDKKKLVIKFENDLVKLDNTGAPATLTAADLIVRDKDGVIIEGLAPTISGDTVTLTSTPDLEDGPYKVEFKANKFKNKEDRSNVAKYIANTVKNDTIIVSVGKEADSNFKYSEFSFSATAAGTEATIDDTNNYFVDADKNTLTFKYPKKMNNSASDVSNYTLDGKALPAGTTVDFVGNKEKVRVVFPEGTFKTSTDYKFGITTNVKTEEGSMIVGSLQTKAPAELVFGVTDNVKPELASAVYYVGTESPDNQTTTNQIEVTFSEAINTKTVVADAKDDFKVTINGSDFEVASIAKTGITGTNNDHKLIITLKEEVNVSQSSTITIVSEDDQDDKKMGVIDNSDNKAKEGSAITLAANNYKYNAALAAIYEANQDIAAAKELVVDVTSDTNLLTTLNALPGMSDTDVTLAVKAEVTGDDTAKVATNGAITKGTAEQTLNVTITIAKTNGTTVEKVIAVTIPAS